MRCCVCGMVLGVWLPSGENYNHHQKDGKSFCAFCFLGFTNEEIEIRDSVINRLGIPADLLEGRTEVAGFVSNLPVMNAWEWGDDE